MSTTKLHVTRSAIYRYHRPFDI